MSRRIFIVDDDEAMRDSLTWLLEGNGYQVRSFASAEQFLAAYDANQVSCLILDVRMPGMSGPELQERMIAENIHLPIVFITGHGDVPMSVAAMKAGAVEFLTKPFRDQDLLDAVHEGIERHRREREQASAMGQILGLYETLSPRERQVAALVASGLMNKQVADRLGLSEVTVKVHRAQIMHKLQARTLADLIRITDRLGITLVQD